MESLLVNLASGVIGALIGAFAAHRLQIRESRRLTKGAARAVYLELTSNLTTLQTARPGGLVIGRSRQELDTRSKHGSRLTCRWTFS
jgi:hypothetical protein